MDSREFKDIVSLIYAGYKVMCEQVLPTFANEQT